MTGRSPAPAVDSGVRGAAAGPRPAALRLPLPPGAPIDPFALAGTSGVVLADGDRVLVGLGRARTLDLPGGLDDGDAIDAATAALAAVPSGIPWWPSPRSPSTGRTPPRWWSPP